MHCRFYTLAVLLFLFCNRLPAQEFVSLDWENPSPFWLEDKIIETDMPGFAGAQYDEQTGLPYYIYTEEVGDDYVFYEYKIKIEYPEYAFLTKKEITAIKKKNICLLSSPEIKTKVSVSAKVGTLSAKIIPLVYKDDRYLRLNSFKITVSKKLKSIRKSAAIKKNYAENSVLASGKWMKLSIKESGIYKITAAELSKMGFTDISKVKLYGYGGRILSGDLTQPKIDDLQEVPLWREAGYVLFYGYGTIRWEKRKSIFVHTQNHYSTYGCYFLTEGDTPALFPVEASLPEDGATVQSTFPDYALYEKEEFAWTEGGRKLFENYDYKSGASKSYTFNNLRGITNDAGIVSIAFSACDKKKQTTLAASVNGSALQGVVSISNSSGEYTKAAIGEKDFVWNGDKNEKIIVNLTHNRNDGISGHLDYIRLNYTRKLALYDSYTAFRSANAGKIKYVIANADENTCVWHITDGAYYKQIKGSLSGNSYTFTYDGGETEEFVVLNPKGDFKKVEVVGEVVNQNLHQLADVDMIIITPPNADFIKQARRLAEAHEKQDGLKTEIVTSEQVYNEFSSGTPDATAYRWLMKMLYDRSDASREPKYLLLFGDCTFDNRLLTLSWTKYKQEDFLLCYESYNSVSNLSSFVSDDYFGMLDNDDVVKDDLFYTYAVDIGVGRIPVRTGTQAKEVVDKMIAYMENKNAGAWKNTVAFLGDDGKKTDGNIHMQQSDDIARVLSKYNPTALIKKVYWDAYKMERTATGNSYPEAKKRILELFDEGMLFMNYCGHGGPSSFSDEYVLTTADVIKISSPKVPFWFTAACDIAPFDKAEESMGECALLNPKGGAIGLMTTARTVLSANNGEMDSIFVRFLFSGSCPRLGDAVRKAKAHISSVSAATNNLQFAFLGDPALRLSLPEYEMVVDELNGKPLNDETPLVKAGSKLMVKGRVLDSNGDLAEDFFGRVYPTVMDSEEKITTYNNNELADSAFVYYDRPKTLFAGSDSVRAGTFEFEIPIPLDINYSNENGLINLYSVSEDYKREGNGVFTSFLLGGTDEGAMDTDSVGPKMNVYLNTPDFISGGKVNTTPYLVAELEDQDGINVIGSGIGHDVIAVIDNSPVYTFVLNNYYEAEFGDYRKGTVRYSFPELPEGEHTLMFRAWDVKNNSSSVVLDFRVVDKMPVELAEIVCMSKGDNATFMIKHDRPNTELEVNVSVYDYAGRILWRHDETGTSSDNNYYIDWNLRTSSGQKLVKGIYLYRISVVSGGSKSVSKANKLLITK